MTSPVSDGLRKGSPVSAAELQAQIDALTPKAETGAQWAEICALEAELILLQGVAAQQPPIITSFDYPPIPVRCCDWSALRDGYDEGDPIGHGRTEKDAIADLRAQEEDV